MSVILEYASASAAGASFIILLCQKQHALANNAVTHAAQTERRLTRFSCFALFFSRISVSRIASAARVASAICITASAGRKSRRDSLAAGTACAPKDSPACSAGARPRSRPVKKVCTAILNIKRFTPGHSTKSDSNRIFTSWAPLEIGFDRANKRDPVCQTLLKSFENKALIAPPFTPFKSNFKSGARESIRLGEKPREGERYPCLL